MVSSSYLSSLPHSLTHSLTDPNSRPYLTDLPHRPTSQTLPHRPYLTHSLPHSLTDLSSLPHSLTHRLTHRRTRGAGGGRDTLTKALQQGHATTLSCHRHAAQSPSWASSDALVFLMYHFHMHLW